MYRKDKLLANVAGLADAHTDFYLIERIFNQMSSSVSIGLMKRDRLNYEFYGGKRFNSAGADSHINRRTRFNMGTASMPITGSLIIKLMEFGEIRLNDKVKRFIPEFNFPDVEVFHLLTHTSGLAFNSFPQPVDYSSKKAFFKQIYNYNSFSYETGTESRLFPYGYAILADIVERMSGQTIEEFASALVFMPIGMRNTTYGSVSLRDDQFIVPWSHKENRFLTETKNHLSTGYSGVFTTVLDLLKFGQMLLNGGESNGRQVFLESTVNFILKEITSDRFMRTPLFMINSRGNNYGFFAKYQSHKTIAHTGDTGSLFFVDPVSRTVGAALTNSTWVNDSSRNYGNICEILSNM